MKTYQLITFLIFFSLPISPVLCQNHLVVNINRDTYKAANKNWAIGQDERGVVYFGNDIGLLESDGMEWQLYRIPNSSIVRAIAVQSHQTIFTGGFEEFGRWDRDISGKLKYTSFKALLEHKELQNENIWKIWIAQDKVYFQSFSCIYIYENDSIRKLNNPNGFLFLLKVRNEYLVQEIFGSLYKIDQDEMLLMKNTDFLKGTTTRVILPYGKEQYLIGVSSGEIYIYDGKQATLWNKHLSDQLAGKELNCGLYSSKRNLYYLGTQLNGIYEINMQGQITNHFSTTNSLQNNTILSLYEDDQNNIWVAMDRGLAYIRYIDGLSYYKSSDRDAGATYDSVLWKDKIFIGTNQGVYYTSPDKLNEPDFFSSLRLINGTQGQIWSFFQSDGKLFCGHNNGILEIKPNLTATDVYNINTGVFRIIETKIQGINLLVVTTYKDLIIIRKDTEEVMMMKQIQEPINKAEVDHLENIWLETVSGGIYKCKFDTHLKAFRYFTYYGHEKDTELPVKLKLFKSGGRILFLGEDTFWSYEENTDKLISNNYLNECFKSTKDIKKIVYIDKDQNWAITGSSVYRFYYDGYIAYMLDSYHIDSDNLSLINMYENISVLNDSLSMICLDTGFIIHNSQTSSPKEVILPNPAFESIQISNKNKEPLYLYPENNSDISYNYNDVTIHFTVNNSFASGVVVEYRLNGVDKEWNTPVKTNRVTYDRLPKGNYTFLIRSTDGLGHYSETVSLAFNILPPWYHTIWAYLSYVVIILLILYGIWCMILRRYRNIHLQKVRAREAQHLRMMNEKLVDEIKQKNAELLTQTSFIIQKNELIMKLKNIMDDFSTKNNIRSLQPLYQKMNALLSNNLDGEEDWKMFLIKFEQKHEGFFKQLKLIYPQLTNNDLRLCACLKLNLDTKDIASLMNLSIRAVENNRYRLRKKINLSPTENLNDFFLKLG